MGGVGCTTYHHRGGGGGVREGWERGERRAAGCLRGIMRGGQAAEAVFLLSVQQLQRQCSAGCAGRGGKRGSSRACG